MAAIVYRRELATPAAIDWTGTDDPARAMAFDSLGFVDVTSGDSPAAISGGTLAADGITMGAGDSVTLADLMTATGTLVLHFTPSAWTAYASTSRNLINRTTSNGHVFHLEYAHFSGFRNFRFRFRGNFGGTINVTSQWVATSDADLNREHTVVLTWDAAAGVGMLHDGQWSFTSGTTGTPNSPSDLLCLNPGATTVFHGLAKFNRAMSEAECRALANTFYDKFKTGVDVRDEYMLPHDGVDDSVTIDVPPLTYPGDRLDGRWGVRCKLNAASNMAILEGLDFVLRQGAAGSTINVHTIDLQAAGIDVNQWHTYECHDTWDGTTKTSRLYIDGVLKSTVNPGSISHFHYTKTARYSSNFYAVSIAAIWQHDAKTPSNSRFYDFDQTSGSTVPERINGQNGTILGGATFQRALPVDERQVGVAHSFTLQQFVDSTKSISGVLPTAVIHDAQAAPTGFTGFTQGVHLKAATGKEADGKGTGAAKITGTLSLAQSGPSWADNLTLATVDTSGASAAQNEFRGCEIDAIS